MDHILKTFPHCARSSVEKSIRNRRILYGATLTKMIILMSANRSCLVTKSCVGKILTRTANKKGRLVMHGSNIRFSYMKGKITLTEFDLIFQSKNELEGTERGAFLFCFFFPACLFFRFSLFFETPRLRSKQ